MDESAGTWLQRAALARRVASTLGPRDAEILHDYAVECEARAQWVAQRQEPVVPLHEHAVAPRDPYWSLSPIETRSPSTRTG